jgi:RimJ/RimL family protein N-acetyltransferase
MTPSPRLTYQEVSPACLDELHRLVEDDHVRRYLMDGERHPRSWTEARIADSQALFRRRGVGLWLARQRTGDEEYRLSEQQGALRAPLIGFCGFLEAPGLHPEPQIVYALFERFTGQGHASEMARAAIAHARQHPGFQVIHAAVDEVNAASVRVLEKLGFQRTGTTAGAFGQLLLYALPA